jgi:hypothetical protein
MKATLNIEANNEDKLRLLIRVAEEMGMQVKTTQAVDDVSIASENVLAEDWDSPEDARWDELYAHLKK